MQSGLLVICHCLTFHVTLLDYSDFLEKSYESDFSQCDEVHPVCGGCSRHKVSCKYEDRSPARTVEVSEASSMGNSPSRATSSVRTEISGIESSQSLESKERRLLELRLLHQYTTKTCFLILVDHESDPLALELWQTAVPNLAFKNDALLYSLYAVAALHLARTGPYNNETLETYRHYLDEAIREHNNDITNLSRANADAACVTSHFTRLVAFAIIQERELKSYTPPAQWLQMTRGAADVHKAAWDWIKSDEDSVPMRFIRRWPVVIDPDALYTEENQQGLLHLLHRSQDHEAVELWSAEVQQAYAGAISVIGSTLKAIVARDTRTNIGRRLITFPLLIPERYMELVLEMKPRALVILAHFFFLLVRLSDVWWIGDSGPREVQGIKTVLSGKWLDMLNWSINNMEGQIANR